MTRFAASVASSASRSSPNGVPGSACVLIGTARQRARAPWKIATAPGYVGFSIFADQVEGLLAPIGDEQIFIFGRDTVVMQHFEQRFFQGWIAVRGAKIQHVRAFAAKHRVHASL